MMGANRVILKRTWTHPYRSEPYKVGTILQVDSQLGSELIESETAEKYEGEYPPKQKVKTDFFKPKADGDILV